MPQQQPRPQHQPMPQHQPRPQHQPMPQHQPRPQHQPMPQHQPRPQRPMRDGYNSPTYHRPHGHIQFPYSHYYHTPYQAPYVHVTRYYRSYDWYNWVVSFNPQYVYVHWLFFPAPNYGNGYWVINDYPFFIYNGYQYRYSSEDYCNYQLVDQYTHEVLQNYWNQRCNVGYDFCSYERDRLNAQMNEFRYFCSETYRSYGYDYSRPTYEEDSYSNCTDYNQDGYCD